MKLEYSFYYSSYAHGALGFYMFNMETIFEILELMSFRTKLVTI